MADYRYPSKTQLKQEKWDRAAACMKALAAREQAQREQDLNRTCAQIGWKRESQRAVRFT